MLVLSKVLDALKKDPQQGLDDDCVTQLIEKELIAMKKARASAGGYVSLARGQATIPLPGIDVPFHSTFLQGGVTAFRSILRERLDPNFFDATKLVGR